MSDKPVYDFSDLDDPSAEALPAVHDEQSIEPMVEMDEQQGRDLVNQLLGQAQMAGAIGMFSRTVRISKMLAVKESKAYKHLTGTTPHGAELKGTWEDFCGLLGVSVDKADRDIANLKAFGEEAMEQMQRIGIGYRDFAQYRKLPEDARAQLIEVAKSGDKEELVELAEVLIEKHNKEKTEWSHSLSEVKANKAQATANLQKAELENEKLHKQLAEATRARADITDVVPPHVSDIRLETAALYHKAELSIDGIARLIPETHLLDGEWALSTARSTFAALQSLIALAKGAAVELHKAYGADLDGDHHTLERLTQTEMFKCAVEYRELTGIHGKEAEKRQYERDQDKPKGRGRPKAAPKFD